MVAIKVKNWCSITRKYFAKVPRKTQILWIFFKNICKFGIISRAYNLCQRKKEDFVSRVLWLEMTFTSLFIQLYTFKSFLINVFEDFLVAIFTCLLPCFYLFCTIFHFSEHFRILFGSIWYQQWVRREPTRIMKPGFSFFFPLTSSSCNLVLLSAKLIFRFVSWTSSWSFSISLWTESLSLMINEYSCKENGKIEWNKVIR